MILGQVIRMLAILKQLYGTIKTQDLGCVWILGKDYYGLTMLRSVFGFAQRNPRF
jgi:hypothetical protein